MESIFDELQQFIIKHVTETIMLEKQEYTKLIEGKKYIIGYFDDENKPILFEYAGKYSDTSPCYPGVYGSKNHIKLY